MTPELNIDYVGLAKNELRTRRQRNLYFSNAHIFGDPAWELVLEAYIATIENRCVALSDLGNKLRRPGSVLTRLAAILKAEGYIQTCRTYSRQDAEAVELTPDAIAWCEQCLELKSDDGDTR